jgi:hypothetical protein
LLTAKSVYKKSVAFLYVHNKQLDYEIKRKNISFPIASKEYYIPRNNYDKRFQDFLWKKLLILLSKILIWGTSPYSWVKNSVS